MSDSRMRSPDRAAAREGGEPRSGVTGSAFSRALARGLSNAEMAKRVFISEKTVRSHLTSIFNKLDVDSGAKAIVLARDGELVK